MENGYFLGIQFTTMKRITIICVASLVLVSFQTVLAYSITYEVAEPLKSGTPLVCVFEPDYETDSNISSGVASLMLSETRGAIDHWENMLKERERIRNDQQKWEITYKEILLEDQKSFDIIPCSVLVRFLPVPHLQDFWLKALGTNEYLDDEFGDFRLISVFYNEITSCESHRDQYYIYYDPCYSSSVIKDVQLGNTVRHEFGHALGLGHYYSDDEELNEQWSTLQVSPPSIMVKFGPTIMKEQEIRQIDVDKVREVYGQNGFLQITEQQMEIPNWIRNNAKWWSTNQIPDQDFTKGLEYLIKQGIMKIPNLPQQSSVTAETKVPEWVKNNAKWWSEGQISDEDFVKGIQYLVENGIIRV